MSSCTVMALETTEMLKIDKRRFFEILTDHSNPIQKLGPVFHLFFFPQAGLELRSEILSAFIMSTLVLKSGRKR